MSSSRAVGSGTFGTASARWRRRSRPGARSERSMPRGGFCVKPRALASRDSDQTRRPISEHRPLDDSRLRWHRRTAQHRVAPLRSALRLRCRACRQVGEAGDQALCASDRTLRRSARAVEADQVGSAIKAWPYRRRGSRIDPRDRATGVRSRTVPITRGVISLVWQNR